MNFLILTPDGVGSTILQRLITITLHLEKQPVINTHELLNGIELKDNIATKNFALKYSQSLDEIKRILQKSDQQTALVSRLAKYHIDNRKDNAEKIKTFFNFLDQKFENKIMCVRENIFEYAMSWSIRQRSGLLNVYNKAEIVKVAGVSEVDEEYFMGKCHEYVKYINWMEQHFPDIKKVSYEDMVKNTDFVLQKLTGYNNTFTNAFGIDLSEILSHEYDFLRHRTKTTFSNSVYKALAKYRMLVNKMIDSKKIVLGVPLKNTTLADKRNQIKNFDSCLDKFYKFAKNHNWIDQSKATYDFWNEQHIC
jgi:hypothetical protein